MTLTRRLDEVAAIQPGWLDGHGEAVTVDARVAAERVLAGLMHRLGLPTPRLYPTEEGGVSAEWPRERRPGPTLSVEFEPTGEAEVMLEVDDQVQHARLVDVEIESLRRVVALGSSW